MWVETGDGFVEASSCIVLKLSEFFEFDFVWTVYHFAIYM